MDSEANKYNLLEQMLLDANQEPIDLPLSLLKDITNNFSEDRKIGSGGFAVVYEGRLHNGSSVAVKRLSQAINMDENNFSKEVTNLIRVKHQNVVRFLGYCADTQGKVEKYGGKMVMADVQQRLLCFEFLPNGSLDKHLNNVASGGLEWTTCYQIIKGLCWGLYYLHQQNIVHLDLKPANILLDYNMVPKIPDFGLSRCFDEKQTRAVTANVVGTMGYMAPEFINSGVITIKSDIYSLGIIIIEILTGQKGYLQTESVLESWSTRFQMSHAGLWLEHVKICAKIGLECMDSDPLKRPITRQIIERLTELERTYGFIETNHSAITIPLSSDLPDGIPIEKNTCEYMLVDQPTSHWLEKHYLIGRDSELKKLTELLMINYIDKRIIVISVFGVGGVGKSFLVEAFFNHYLGAFKSCAMVNAPHPFDIMKFCQNLFLCFKLTRTGEDEDISLLCLKHLEEHQCLLVIDGLRSMEDWDLIEANLISRASKSCIIVVTREESVARHCAMSDVAVCNVKGLEADAALRLFEKAARRQMGTTYNWDSNMLEDAGLIINKFGRLPKLIVDLAKYLAKVRDGISEAQRLNANFLYVLKTRTGLDSFRDELNRMHSTFQYCSPVLKKCIFYLSIFTQSSMIRRSRLVRRWIAEGYSEGTDSNSMIEYMESLIHHLTTLGIMMEQTPVVAGGLTYCQINSLFVEYIISREIEENVSPLPLEVCVLRGGSSLNTQRAGQHLAIGSSWRRDKFVFGNLDFSQLQSLTVSREWRTFFISDRMTVLCVLDLEDTNVKDEDIEQILKHVPRLKFLSLRRCTKVSFLPDSLGELRQLQTLDIRHTYVTKLPKSISKLQKLQYIRAATSVALMDDEPSTSLWRSRHGHVDTCDGVMVPGGIGELTALHTLGVVNLSGRGGKVYTGGLPLLYFMSKNKRGGNVVLNELKNLTQLHKLGVSGINRSNFKGFFSAIVGHSHLDSLSLQLKDSDYDWLDKFIPPVNLRHLKMLVHVEKYPHWSCLKVLGQIKRLQTLSLRFKTGQDVELQFSDSLDNAAWSRFQFCELRVLEIACSSNLHVKFAEREMHELEVLKVHCLHGSSLKLSGIEYPSSLKHVWLKGSFDDTVKEELRHKVAQHRNKPFFKLG